MTKTSPSLAKAGIRSSWRSSRERGITLLELLLVVGIVGIILGLSVLSGRRILQAQQERATLHSFKQAVARSATAANAGNRSVALTKVGNAFRIVDMVSGKTLQDYPIAASVKTGLAQNGPLLEFEPSGKATFQSLNSLQPPGQPLVFTTPTQTYVISVSRIGEVQVAAQ